MPTSKMQGTVSFSKEDFAAIRDNAILNRYGEILSFLLNQTKPTGILKARAKIVQRLRDLGLRVGSKDGQYKLSDRLRTNVPIAWLTEQFPAIATHPPGDFFSPIDSITYGRPSVMVYVLALATLFETPEEALAYWTSDICNLPPVGTRGRLCQKLLEVQ